jgi:hypothetical protein
VNPSPKHRKRGSLFWVGVAIAAVIFVFFASLQPGSVGGPKTLILSEESCHLIAGAMTDYAKRHGGKYPDGRSSTEVFQKLLDDGGIDNYGESAAIFFVPLPGKVRALDGEKLRPENVAYNVTSGVDATSPANLPVVYLTGFRLDFKPNGSAVSSVRPLPYWLGPPSFFGNWWWILGSIQHNEINWITVAHKNAKTYVLDDDGHPLQFTPTVSESFPTPCLPTSIRRAKPIANSRRRAC